MNSGTVSSSVYMLSCARNRLTHLPPGRLYFRSWTCSNVLCSVQFADGVILLLLIGQLEGFFIPLCDFNLTPVNDSEMVPYGFNFGFMTHVMLPQGGDKDKSS